MGKVHSGFNQEVNDLWPLMENLLRDTSRPIWFCGHSLGGAMATICAYRCTTSPQTNNPEELHTFGSPRVGCKRYVRHADVCHYRWVHNNDVVTRVPPTWLGYRHSGHQVYLDRHGRIRKLRGVWRTRDRWHGFVKGLLKWKFDPVADHSIHLYTKHIATAVNKENQAIAKGGAATDENDLVIGKKDQVTT